MIELWLASGNKGKINEFQHLLKDLPVTLKTTLELPVYTPPDETGDTFIENARIKAKSLKSIVNEDAWVVADDSGLCVPGLNGLPGVHSARYAGERASFSENNAKLLKMMQLRCAQKREAFFECTLLLLNAKGEEWSTSAQLHGEITKAASGTNGFGYDPVFTPKDKEVTLAELTNAEKNGLSHRHLAVRNLTEHLQTVL